MDERHRPPTWLREERETHVADSNVRNQNHAEKDDTLASDNPSTSNVFRTKLDKEENVFNKATIDTDRVDFVINTNNGAGSMEENADIRASPDSLYFGQVRGSGRNTIGTNINGLRQSRRRTIVCTMLGLFLIILVSAPVIVILFLVKS